MRGPLRLQRSLLIQHLSTTCRGEFQPEDHSLHTLLRNCTPDHALSVFHSEGVRLVRSSRASWFAPSVQKNAMLAMSVGQEMKKNAATCVTTSKAILRSPSTNAQQRDVLTHLALDVLPRQLKDDVIDAVRVLLHRRGYSPSEVHQLLRNRMADEVVTTKNLQDLRRALDMSTVAGDVVTSMVTFRTFRERNPMVSALEFILDTLLPLILTSPHLEESKNAADLDFLMSDIAAFDGFHQPDCSRKVIELLQKSLITSVWGDHQRNLLKASVFVFRCSSRNFPVTEIGVLVEFLVVILQKMDRSAAHNMLEELSTCASSLSFGDNKEMRAWVMSAFSEGYMLSPDCGADEHRAAFVVWAFKVNAQPDFQSTVRNCFDFRKSVDRLFVVSSETVHSTSYQKELFVRCLEPLAEVAVVLHLHLCYHKAVELSKCELALSLRDAEWELCLALITLARFARYLVLQDGAHRLLSQWCTVDEQFDDFFDGVFRTAWLCKILNTQRLVSSDVNLFQVWSELVRVGSQHGVWKSSVKSFGSLLQTNTRIEIGVDPRSKWKAMATWIVCSNGDEPPCTNTLGDRWINYQLRRGKLSLQDFQEMIVHYKDTVVSLPRRVGLSTFLSQETCDSLFTLAPSVVRDYIVRLAMNEFAMLGSFEELKSVLQTSHVAGVSVALLEQFALNTLCSEDSIDNIKPMMSRRHEAIRNLASAAGQPFFVVDSPSDVSLLARQQTIIRNTNMLIKLTNRPRPQEWILEMIHRHQLLDAYAAISARASDSLNALLCDCNFLRPEDRGILLATMFQRNTLDSLRFTDNDYDWLLHHRIRREDRLLWKRIVASLWSPDGRVSFSRWAFNTEFLAEQCSASSSKELLPSPSQSFREVTTTEFDSSDALSVVRQLCASLFDDSRDIVGMCLRVCHRFTSADLVVNDAETCTCELIRFWRLCCVFLSSRGVDADRTAAQAVSKAVASIAVAGSLRFDMKKLALIAANGEWIYTSDVGILECRITGDMTEAVRSVLVQWGDSTLQLLNSNFDPTIFSCLGMLPRAVAKRILAGRAIDNYAYFLRNPSPFVGLEVVKWLLQEYKTTSASEPLRQFVELLQRSGNHAKQLSRAANHLFSTILRSHGQGRVFSNILGDSFLAKEHVTSWRELVLHGDGLQSFVRLLLRRVADIEGVHDVNFLSRAVEGIVDWLLHSGIEGTLSNNDIKMLTDEIFCSFTVVHSGVPHVGSARLRTPALDRVFTALLRFMAWLSQSTLFSTVNIATPIVLQSLCECFGLTTAGLHSLHMSTAQNNNRMQNDSLTSSALLVFFSGRWKQAPQSAGEIEKLLKRFQADTEQRGLTVITSSRFTAALLHQIRNTPCVVVWDEPQLFDIIRTLFLIHCDDAAMEVAEMTCRRVLWSRRLHDLVHAVILRSASSKHLSLLKWLHIVKGYPSDVAVVTHLKVVTDLINAQDVEASLWLTIAAHSMAQLPLFTRLSCISRVSDPDRALLLRWVSEMLVSSNTQPDARSSLLHLHSALVGPAGSLAAVTQVAACGSWRQGVQALLHTVKHHVQSIQKNSAVTHMTMSILQKAIAKEPVRGGVQDAELQPNTALNAVWFRSLTLLGENRSNNSSVDPSLVLRVLRRLRHTGLWHSAISCAAIASSSSSRDVYFSTLRYLITDFDPSLIPLDKFEAFAKHARTFNDKLSSEKRLLQKSIGRFASHPNVTWDAVLGMWAHCFENEPLPQKVGIVALRHFTSLRQAESVLRLAAGARLPLDNDGTLMVTNAAAALAPRAAVALLESVRRGGPEFHKIMKEQGEVRSAEAMGLIRHQLLRGMWRDALRVTSDYPLVIQSPLFHDTWEAVRCSTRPVLQNIAIHFYAAAFEQGKIIRGLSECPALLHAVITQADAGNALPEQTAALSHACACWILCAVATNELAQQQQMDKICFVLSSIAVDAFIAFSKQIAAGWDQSSTVHTLFTVHSAFCINLAQLAAKHGEWCLPLLQCMSSVPNSAQQIVESITRFVNWRDTYTKAFKSLQTGSKILQERNVVLFASNATTHWLSALAAVVVAQPLVETVEDGGMNQNVASRVLVVAAVSGEETFIQTLQFVARCRGGNISGAVLQTILHLNNCLSQWSGIERAARCVLATQRGLSETDLISLMTLLHRTPPCCEKSVLVELWERLEPLVERTGLRDVTLMNSFLRLGADWDVLSLGKALPLVDGTANIQSVDPCVMISLCRTMVELQSVMKWMRNHHIASTADAHALLKSRCIEEFGAQWQPEFERLQSGGSIVTLRAPSLSREVEQQAQHHTHMQLTQLPRSEWNTALDIVSTARKNGVRLQAAQYEHLVQAVPPVHILPVIVAAMEDGVTPTALLMDTVLKRCNESGQWGQACAFLAALSKQRTTASQNAPGFGRLDAPYVVRQSTLALLLDTFEMILLADDNQDALLDMMIFVKWMFNFPRLPIYPPLMVEQLLSRTVQSWKRVDKEICSPAEAVRAVAQLLLRMQYLSHIQDSLVMDVAHVLTSTEIDSTFQEQFLDALQMRPSLQSRVAATFTIGDDSFTADNVLSKAADYSNLLQRSLSDKSLRVLSMVQGCRGTPSVMAWEAALVLVSKSLPEGESSVSLLLPMSETIKHVGDGDQWRISFDLLSVVRRSNNPSLCVDMSLVAVLIQLCRSRSIPMESLLVQLLQR